MAIRMRSQCTCELRSCVGLQRLSEPAGSGARVVQNVLLRCCRRAKHGEWQRTCFAQPHFTGPTTRPHQPWAAAPRSGAVARHSTAWQNCVAP